MKYNPRTLLFIVLVIGILLVCSLDTYAQCSMCKAVLSGSNNGKFIRNLNIGILVLLLPPVSIFCSIFIILRRHRGDGVKEGHESPQI
ncbi:MAG TPA: hypothetical protein VJ372_20560 [Pyrinomonadaceae bacterium]|jgi:hypothetical protein|nr:hypothetical protein [Pyrinomonadaceae bacterium]